MNRSRVVVALVFFGCCLPNAGLPQQNQSAPSPAQTTAPVVPTDPAALLQLASKLNGLHGADLQPWHVRATWQTLDEERQPKEQGIWEEWWAGEKKYRMTYKSADVERTIYGTDRGRHEVGAAGKVPWQFATVERLVNGPVQMLKASSAMKPVLNRTDVQQGTVKLSCVLQDVVAANGNPSEVRRPDGTSRQLEFRDCFSGNLPAVRAEETSQGSQTVFNSIVRFQGRYLAKKIRYVGAGGVETDISIDTLEALDDTSDAGFVPPANATEVPSATGVLAVPGIVMAGYRIAGEMPIYPEDARHFLHSEGTVILTAKILKDGTMGDLKVISGPLALQQAAIDAVKTWRYRPYLLNGEPVEVETQINVVFRMGH